MEILTAQLKQQAVQIQKVTAQIEMSKFVRRGGYRSWQSIRKPVEEETPMPGKIGFGS
jgi:hypothetical protein